MLRTQGKHKKVGLYAVIVFGCLLAFLSFQSPAYAQCDVDWNCQTVDSSGYVGKYPSLAFGPLGPAISYHGNGTLKFAYDKNNNGVFTDAGEIVTMDSSGIVGFYTSLAFGSGPAISYYDFTNSALKFAYDKNNNGVFTDAGEIITVDNSGNVGGSTSLAFGSGPAISYYNVTNSALKFAYDRNNNGVFTDAGEIITVDDSGNVGMYTSLAFGSGPAISYYDLISIAPANGDLKLAYDKNNDGDFADANEIITVDSGGNVGRYTSLAFGPSGPAISYYDYNNGDLKFAYDKNNDGDFADTGEIITVDSAGAVGMETSLAFGSGPAISYYDVTNGDLKFAYDKNNDGDFADANEIITVDSGGNVGRYTSLAFGSGPAISYYDLISVAPPNGDLKFARYSPVPVGGEVQFVDLSELGAIDNQLSGDSKSHVWLALAAGLASVLAIGGGVFALRRRKVH